jgi:hypothetical protein
MLQPTPTSGLAQLTGGNTFNGSQTVNGTITATSFVGDGSSLTGVNAQTAQTANTATFAASAGTAMTASNSLALGGVPPSGYAPAAGSANYIQNNSGPAQPANLNISGNATVGGNASVTGDLAAAGTITIGSDGTAIAKHVSMQFQNVAFNLKLTPGTCTVWSGVVLSATDGDTVAVGLASSLMTANIVFSAWAGNGSVSVRICNPSGAPTTLGVGNLRVDVWKH